MTWVHNTSRRTRIIGLVGIALLLFILFEIGIRFIPPNEMTFTWTLTSSGALLYQTSSSDPKAVAYWYHYANSSQKVTDPAIFCNGTPPNYIPETGTYTFTFLGVPIESFSGDRANVCPFYRQSAGGLPDIFDRNFISENPGTYSDPINNK